jgi:hypothetical protein
MGILHGDWCSYWDILDAIADKRVRSIQRGLETNFSLNPLKTMDMTGSLLKRKY